MSYIREIENKNGTISYKARVNYKGVFLTKTFPVKGNQKRTTYKLAENWCNEIEQKIDDGTYRKEEKRKNYDLKDLKNSLDKYNSNLQVVSEFINKDVAENIVENSKLIQDIKNGNKDVVSHLQEEKTSIDNLAKNYADSAALLKKIVEKNDVNEEYIFDILDKWAEDRKVKTKNKWKK